MTKEELLEVLTRMARDKVTSGQGVIVLVVQDGPSKTDMTAGIVNIETGHVATCLDALQRNVKSGMSNGLLILPGKH